MERIHRSGHETHETAQIPHEYISSAKARLLTQPSTKSQRTCCSPNWVTGQPRQTLRPAEPRALPSRQRRLPARLRAPGPPAPPGRALGTGLSRRRRGSGSGAGRPRGMRTAGTGPVPTGDPRRGGRAGRGGPRGPRRPPPRPHRACAARRLPPPDGQRGRASGSRLIPSRPGRRFPLSAPPVPHARRAAAAATTAARGALPVRLGAKGKSGSVTPAGPPGALASAARPATYALPRLPPPVPALRGRAAPLSLLVFTDKTIWRPLALPRK